MQEKLFTPGPVEIPERILRTLSEPVIHHRTEEHVERLRNVMNGMRRVLLTQGDILIIASSGTGGMEASVSSLVAGRGSAVSVNSGKFGERWGELCRAFSVPCNEIKVPEGEALDPEKVVETVLGDRDVKALFLTLTETSTGVVHDIEAVGKGLSQWEGLIIVDAVSGLIADELRMDAWRVDAVVTGSQKGLMLPPGLSLVGISPRAKAVLQSRPRGEGRGSYYLDLRRYVDSLQKDDVPFTPAIGLIRALLESLDLILEEGMEAVWARHHRVASAVRAAVVAMGMELFARTSPSNAVTAAIPPDGVQPADLMRMLRERKGIRIAGGQGSLKGKIVRVAHLGACYEEDVLGVIGAMESCLRRLGADIENGKGVMAAEAVLSQKIESNGEMES